MTSCDVLSSILYSTYPTRCFGLSQIELNLPVQLSTCIWSSLPAGTGAAASTASSAKITANASI